MNALGRHIPPRLTEARLARQWSAIDTAFVRPSQRRGIVWGGSFAGLAAAMGIVALWLAHHRAEPAATIADGTVLESPPSAVGPAVTLADGSRVTLAEATRVRLARASADSVRIELERGRVDVAATHAVGRTFVVVAHGCEVTVVGTRFDVVVRPDARAEVDVTEGRVHVRTPNGETRAVSAGESWIEAEPREPDVEHASEASEDSGSEPATIDVDESVTATDASADRGRVRNARGENATTLDAKHLLEAAQRANAAGRTREAAELFDSLRKHHRTDARAALAAFNLGRLRLDLLGDPAGAEEAFADAARLARSGTLREDAEARRVEALDAMGSASCARARDAYLTRYTRGIHRAEVAARCAGR